MPVAAAGSASVRGERLGGLRSASETGFAAKYLRAFHTIYGLLGMSSSWMLTLT